MRAARSARRPTGAEGLLGSGRGALLGCCGLSELAGEPGYLESLRHTLDWVDGVQVDRAAGDWHGVIAPTGATSGNKADQWKDPYHQTRALLEVSALADHPLELSVPGLH